MASITIRNMDERDKSRLRIQAAKNGRSMEAEARTILKNALMKKTELEVDLATAIQQRFSEFGGVELPDIPREPAREPVDFSNDAS